MFKLAGLTAFVIALPAFAADVSFKDPSGDDFGPGTYQYPTKVEYKKGSFDLTEVEIKDKGADLEISIGVNASATRTRAAMTCNVRALPPLAHALS